MAVRFNNHTPPINTSRKQDTDFVLLTLAVHTVTTKL